MANWIKLSGDNIRLLDTEKTIMENVTPLQDLDSCVLSASNYARGYLVGIFEAAPAVPPEVVDDVIAIARFTYLTQDPTGTLLTDIRQKEYDSAIRHLRDISNEISSITPGELPPNTTDILIGKWGSSPRVATVTELTPWAPVAPQTPP